ALLKIKLPVFIQAFLSTNELYYILLYTHEFYKLRALLTDFTIYWFYYSRVLLHIFFNTYSP
ncbi:MAG: hypothetical protein RRY78_06120, partial [Clostridia bacterium]